MGDVYSTGVRESRLVLLPPFVQHNFFNMIRNLNGGNRKEGFFKANNAGGGTFV